MKPVFVMVNGRRFIAFDIDGWQFNVREEEVRRVFGELQALFTKDERRKSFDAGEVG